jgi:RimJ/RimL family protein N-acetyltransferase
MACSSQRRRKKAPATTFPLAPLAGAAIMLVQTSRFVLRDFRESDRLAYVAYQMDPRYRRLYHLRADDRRAHELFDRFLSWQEQDPRRDLQVGVFGIDTGRLLRLLRPAQVGRTRKSRLPRDRAEPR